jgi:hypothetical protein
MNIIYRSYKFWIPLGTALLLCPVAFILAWASVGAGHPSHLLVISKIAFPYVILCSLLVTADTAAALIVSIVPVVQMLVYGIILGLSWEERRPKWTAWLLGAHVLASIIATVVHPDNAL